jgi:hypothetical protein
MIPSVDLRGCECAAAQCDERWLLTRSSSQWVPQKSTQYLSCTNCELPLHLSIIMCTTLFPLVTTSTATDSEWTQRSQK